MKMRWIYIFISLIFSLTFLACSTSSLVDNGGSGSGGSTGGSNTPAPTPIPPKIVFTPVGSSLGSNLIDLEFLPGQNGESILISQDGTVYYLKSNFSPLAATVTLPVEFSGEQGLLNVVADPLYATNHDVYFYYTVQSSNPTINRVDRYTVLVNTNTGTFQLQDARKIIEFNKTTSSDIHNGGGLAFMSQDDLAIGVGEGGISNFAQSTNSRLGKIHRIIPDRTAGGDTSAEHFSIPPDQVAGQPHNASTTEPSIFSLGVRNPFTIVVDEDGDLFFGDVGLDTFEELDCAYLVDAPENYGWPLCEGACNPSNSNFRDPTHGFRHGDSTFDDQDPAINPNFGEAIMMNAFYGGSAYGGAFTDKYIYSEFYHGWVRLLTLNSFDQVIDDQHLGHLEGLISLHENPANGLLYGVSLFGSDNVQRDHILRLDLVP